MKRWTLRILGCLVLGAITTVAVAWGCVRWSRIEWTRPIPAVYESVPEVHQYFPIRDTVVSIERTLISGFGVHVEELVVETDRGLWAMEIIEAGFPCFSLTGRSFGGASSQDVWWTDHGRIRIFRKRIGLPLQPMSLLFVVDTLFYAAIWGGLFFAFMSAKRFIRNKRGLCSQCGYDLRGQRTEFSDQRSDVSGVRAGCPECGWGRE